MSEKIILGLKDQKCCEGNCGCNDQKIVQPIMGDTLETDCGCGCGEDTNGCGCGEEKEDCGCDEETNGCGCGRSVESLKIDFLYLDLSVCSRCQSTESTLEASLEEIKDVLLSANYEVTLNKIHIKSLEDALKYEFESSPTIRVNGKDVISKTLESNCKDCGDLCGSDIDCRDWEFQGVRYTEPPKAMLMNAIFKAIYVPETLPARNNNYVVPQNIIKFFELLKTK